MFYIRISISPEYVIVRWICSTLKGETWFVPIRDKIYVHRRIRTRENIKMMESIRYGVLWWRVGTSCSFLSSSIDARYRSVRGSFSRCRPIVRRVSRMSTLLRKFYRYLRTITVDPVLWLEERRANILYWTLDFSFLYYRTVKWHLKIVKYKLVLTKILNIMTNAIT